MNVHLTRIDRQPSRRGRGSVDAYMVVRNEADRLPYLLEYHRRLGVDRFFICDNNSEDHTMDFLLSQGDCVVYHTAESFGEAGCGMNWINAMVERHGEGNWCLFIDADELFVYPHSEQIPIRQFCDLLERSGHEGVFAIMVDMYAPGTVADAIYKPGTSFVDTCPCFDTEYRVRTKAGLPFSKRFLNVEAVGGPRLRVFYPRYHRTGIWPMAVARAMRNLRLHPLGKAIGLQRTNIGSLPPDITKVPLMRARPGRKWVTNHRTDPLPLSPITGALLHFKLFSNFDERARHEVSRGEHWDSGVEYRRYVERLSKHPGEGFIYGKSERYHSSDDLLRHGIIHSVPELDTLVADDVLVRPPIAIGAVS
jgi:hypothetical protein